MQWTECTAEFIYMSCGRVNITSCMEDIEVTFMRFQVLTVVSVKLVVLCNVTPCSSVDRDWYFQEPVASILRVDKFPKDGGVRFSLKCWYLYSELSGITSRKAMM
jgi:hypothetical protein